MKHFLLKANSKKLKWINQKKNDPYRSSNSDSEISSEDENSLNDDENLKFQLLNNRYLVLKYLGRGTFSRVWCVYDILESKYFALKVFFEKYKEDSAEEVDAYKNMKGRDKLVNLYDFFSFRNMNCLVIDLLGYTLIDFMNFCFDEEGEKKIENNIYISLVKKITKKILESLKDIHDCDFIHSDLKLENIMFEDNNFILSEFQNLELKKKYEELILENTPPDFSSFDKNKKKNLKRKIKIRCTRLLVEYIKSSNQQNLSNETNDRDVFFKTIIYESKPFNIKIVDYGNLININDIEEEEIMIRTYRPFENIINNYYDKKADIWAVGCLVFELLTNEYLFDIEKKLDNKKKDIEHLRKMTKFIGHIPKKLWQDSIYSRYIKKFKDIEQSSIQEILEEEFDYEPEYSKNCEIFIKKLLDYRLEERYCASQAICDEWLN